MKPLYILKIGGSVATHKNRLGISVRTSLMKKVALSIRQAKKEKDFDLILIHGAGAAGHQLAHKYSLQNGTGNNPKKWEGALLSRVANGKLNVALAEIFVSGGLRVTSVHTASVITQKNRKIDDFNIQLIETALKNNCIPLLYGEMVFDHHLGMTICSGDAIASHLAKKLKVKKIFFASDIDGVFTQDPHLNKDAKLIREIDFRNLGKNAAISKSHNTDVTNGLAGKVEQIKSLLGSDVSAVEIFNGLEHRNYRLALLGKKFDHTQIKM
jgi:isopentenyl phosphate kinase